MQKVAVLMKHKKNSKLLIDFICQKYEVVQSDKADLLENHYDLVILDDFMLEKLSDDIQNIKQRQVPVFLPLLLITSYRGINIIKDVPLCKQVDDFMKAPVDKSELAYRINSLLKARESSLESDRRYYTLAESLPLGVCIIQDEQFVYLNSLLTKRFTKEKLLDTSFLNYIYPKDREKALGYYKEIYNSSKTTSSSHDIRIFGEGKRWINFHATKITYNEKPALLVISIDITEKMEKDAHMKYLSYHDKLTEVYNRAYFAKELERLDREKLLPLSIIMGDVNNLKLVNDAFGHMEGDKLIKNVAKIIQRCCRKNDIVIRWGGDEFVIILPHAESSDAAAVCNRIKKYCNKNKDYNDVQMEINIALGHATKETNEQSIEEILVEAENRMYRNKLTEDTRARQTLISSLNNTLKEKSFETEEHAGRLQDLAMKIGEKVGLSTADLDELSLLATLHDIGKVGIPEEILLKPDKLDTEEWKKIKTHPEIGYRIVKAIPELAHVAEAILSHHERWDGLGYPRGIKGSQIPIISRIIAIADAYDVMTNRRTYKNSISQEEALKELKRCAGSQFDPELVNHLLNKIFHK